ncbi:unnamed protein product [Miscanthus lutarioriparius]|uniref:AIPP2-like SPOC-like domain-containing protein n=1 Tax=Miscanthus lutarioriparius TaxID=422564 RepID=A0A811RKW2_9POAL|nr:unnamed protein product [Miscanthus lutarioriparius]
MKQPTPSSFKKRLILVEKQKALSRSRVNGKDSLKETHALERKREANDALQPTQLKAMPGLVPKTTDRLGHYSDSASRLKKRASSDKDITSAKYSTTKLEFSKGVYMVHKDSCMTEGKDRQEEIVIDNDKENVKFGEYHKEGDTTKAKHTLDSTLLDIHCNSGKHLFISICNSMSKKRKKPLSAENPKALNDDSNVGVQVDTMSCKQMKKLKQSRVTRKDGAGDGGGDLNHVGVEDDTVGSLKNDHAKVSMASCVEQQCYSCSKPIDKPTWSGIFKTYDKEYASLDGHLSTKSCEKAWSLSKQLLKVVEVKKLSRFEVWPKAWEVSKPIADDIGIYFFPHEMRQDEGLDQLVREVMQNDLALRAIIAFQRKHYPWGVFKHREDKGAVVEEPLNAMGHCEKEKQQNLVLDQPNRKLPSEEPNQEMIRMASVIPLEGHMLPPNKSTQEVEACRLKGPTNKGFDPKAPSEEGGQAEGTPVATDAAAFPASHGQINPSMGHTPGRLMGFVVRKTPKLDRIIREIEQEGALVFAMQGEMVGAGSWAASKGTATQK